VLAGVQCRCHQRRAEFRGLDASSLTFGFICLRSCARRAALGVSPVHSVSTMAKLVDRTLENGPQFWREGDFHLRHISPKKRIKICLEIEGGAREFGVLIRSSDATPTSVLD
jgi:hypothetical protein